MRVPPLVAAAVVIAAIVASPAASQAAEGDEYFTLIVMPDVQYATAYNTDILAAQLAWIRDNATDMHIAALLQEGDIVEHQTSDAEWATASSQFAVLDGLLPMTFAAGNHDIQDYTNAGTKGVVYFPSSTTRYTSFIDSFEHYHVDGNFPAGSMANTYQKLDVLGGKYLILSLQFGAPDDVLVWATQVARDHRDRYVIVVTHDYLGQNSKVRGKPGHEWQIALPSNLDRHLNDPWQIWDGFVRVSPNVKFVFSAHVTTKTLGYDYAIGRLQSTNAAGRYVYQMLANYQTYLSDGQGFLRIVRIYPATGRVEVQTYSPYLDQYLTASKDQFEWQGVNLARLMTKVST